MMRLGENADTLPVGLQGTPFETVYKALRAVAATVWNVDPTDYRAGMAWGWYTLHKPEALVGFRDIVTAAILSAFAPLVKDSQTDEELVEYLRQWRSYLPTFPKLQALYALFGLTVNIQPISDADSQAILPVDDTRLAFYIRIESVDFSRPMSMEEARDLAVRATPLGSRPYPYYALETHIDVPTAAISEEYGVTIGDSGIAQPVIILPTVELGLAAYVYDSGTATAELWPNAYFFGKDSSGQLLQYDSGFSYAVYSMFASKNASEYFCAYFTASEDYGRIKITNISDQMIQLHRVVLALCDSSLATVATVYNSSNAAYSAFKFTKNGTDYYYVLDGTQTDWTDDLSDIGYRLPTYASDDATGTISGLVLPSAHSYTGVSFDSLRYYVKGTLSNTGVDTGAYFGQGQTEYYKGTITWTDESLGDLSDKIAANPTSSSNQVEQTVFRIIFISDGSISGYHPWDAGDSARTAGQITDYSYNNGVHSITLYIPVAWYSGQYAGRIQLRYLDGTTTFRGLNAFDLVNVSSGALSKATTTDRYDMYNEWNGSITIHAEYAT